ncbi:hypothetical protein ACIPLC_15605 [Kitasatospora sp. NPDC086801]|uniref:hypothetical protein n=1 Tax=unclassified Kitasatospora TaxID=2633591 RepID=UPI003830246A
MSDLPRRRDDHEPTFLPPLADADLHIPDFPMVVPEPEPGKPVIRAVPHADELNPRGTVITCEHCKARRDWMLLNVREQVFVRCRCSHEWLERDLTVDYFDQYFSHPEKVWDNFEVAMTSTGYDGAFAGIYLN